MSGMRHDWCSPAGVIAPLKRQEDRAILLDASSHELVGRPLLAADVGREAAHEDLVRRLFAGDGARTNIARLFESTTQRRAVRGILRHGGRVRSRKMP